MKITKTEQNPLIWKGFLENDTSVVYEHKSDFGFWKALKAGDKKPYQKGKLILRIRGTGHIEAGCLMKNIKIYSR